MALMRSAQAREFKRSAFGAHFLVCLLRADINQPTAMLEGIKGLSRHKRVPYHARRASVAFKIRGRVSAARRPLPFIPRPLDPFCAWRCSEAVGTEERRSALACSSPLEVDPVRGTMIRGF